MIALDNYRESRDVLVKVRSTAAHFKSVGVVIYHDAFAAPYCDPWSESDFELAKELSGSKGDVCWEFWSVWPDNVMVSRYWGHDEISRQFVRACETLLQRMSNALLQLSRLNATSETLQGVVLDELNHQDLSTLGSGPHLTLLLVHEWAYRFPTNRLEGRCTAWSDFPPNTANEKEGQPTHNEIFVDLLSAIIAFIDMCLEDDEPTRTGIWDHIPKLSLPNLQVDETLEWLSEELPFFVRDLQLFGKLMEPQDVTATKTSPKRMGIVINSLKELSSLIEASSQEPNARFEKTEIAFTRLKVSLQECESIRAYYEPLMGDEIWRHISDWIQSHPSTDGCDNPTFSFEMKNWLKVGATLLEEAMLSCIGADIWPEVDDENETVTWLGDTKVLSTPNEFRLLALLVRQRKLNTSYSEIGDKVYGDELKSREAIRQAKRSLVKQLQSIGFGGLAASITSPHAEHYWIDEKRLLSHAMSTVTNAVQN